MPKEHSYKFCFGPWNISEGQDPYGPPTRAAQSFDWKLDRLKDLGFDAMMFHDDDAVPDIDIKPDAQVRKEAKALKKRLDDAGIIAEIVAPRLWFSPMTIDGAYTSNDPKCRQYAIDRSLRCIDVGKELGCDLVVLWLAREGTYLRESKDGRRSVDLIVKAIDKMLAHDKKVRIAIEPKPNEPMDHAYIPTIGHALAVSNLTRDPKRVGALIETAHCILAGLDPAKVPSRTLTDLIAFNRAHADIEMPFFGQDIFELSDAKGPLTDPAYLEARAVLDRCADREGLAALFAAPVDVLFATGGGPASLIDHVWGDRGAGGGGAPIASAAAIAGYPSLTVPGGIIEGLPVGLTLVAPRFKDGHLLQIGAALERLLPARVPPRLV